MNRLLWNLGILLIWALLAAGCHGSSPPVFDENPPPETSFYPEFDPAAGTFPFPSDLLFAGSTDGTLNIPVADPTDYSDPQVALDALDGFSTVAPITVSYSADIDPESLVTGRSVRLFRVELSAPAGPVASIQAELTEGVDFIVALSPVDLTGSTLQILPLYALAPETSYLVALTDELEAGDGTPVSASHQYALTKRSRSLVNPDGSSAVAELSAEQAQALEGLRPLTSAAERAVSRRTGLARNAIVLSWTFSTQSISEVLDGLRERVGAESITVLPTGLDTTAADPAFPGLADIYVGSLRVPYYLTAPSAADPTAPLTHFWTGAGCSFLTRFNTVPVATGSETIPLLLTLPNGASGRSRPSGGWPVVISQHGITGDRSQVLAGADAAASQGLALVAIDLPLHGITDTTSPLYAGNTPLPDDRERTFDLDLANNLTGLPGPDGRIDPSGSHFINLQSLLTNRDNLRQGVSDLLTLRASLGGIAELDPQRVYFGGGSLGGIVGAVLLAEEPQVGASVLAVTGGGIAKLLDGSATYGPRIALGLLQQGLVKGTPQYEDLLRAAQTCLDSADPINYADRVAQDRGLLFVEVVGGNSSPPDQVVPNDVYASAPPGTVPSPTAGSTPLAGAMALRQYDAAAQGMDLHAWVRFTAGHHGSPVTPKDAEGNDDPLSAAVYAEMQVMTSQFLASEGSRLVVTDPSLLEPVQ